MSSIGTIQEETAEDEQEKISQEISFMEKKLLEIVNSLNQLVLENDYISRQNKGEEDSEGTEGGVISNDSRAVGDTNLSASSNNETSKKSKDLKEKESENENGSIEKEKEINWKQINTNMEIIYNTWASMILDLYKANANNQDILDVSNEIDKCMQFVNTKDKINCAASLARIYGYLPKFAESSNQGNQMINALKAKSNIINSYAYVEQDNWDKIAEEIKYANENFMNILNSVPDNENSLYNINKAFIMIKELELCLSLKDKQVYYIKYKNLMAEMNKLT